MLALQAGVHGRRRSRRRRRTSERAAGGRSEGSRRRVEVERHHGRRAAGTPRTGSAAGCSRSSGRRPRTPCSARPSSRPRRRSRAVPSCRRSSAVLPSRSFRSCRSNRRPTLRVRPADPPRVLARRPRGCACRGDEIEGIDGPHVDGSSGSKPGARSSTIEEMVVEDAAGLLRSLATVAAADEVILSPGDGLHVAADLQLVAPCELRDVEPPDVALERVSRTADAAGAGWRIDV